LPRLFCTYTSKNTPPPQVGIRSVDDIRGENMKRKEEPKEEISKKE
jgi:hypothetical protein